MSFYRAVVVVATSSLLLLAFLSACRQAETPSVGEVHPPEQNDATTRLLGQAGGIVGLENGTQVEFDAGFFETTSEVKLSTFLEPPAEFLEAVNLAQASASLQAIGLLTKIELTYAGIDFRQEAFDARKQMRVRIPPFPGPHPESLETFAEIIVHYKDGSAWSYIEPYHVTGVPPREGVITDTITLNNLQLKASFAESPELVAVYVRPVIAQTPVVTFNLVPTGFVLEDVVEGLNQGVVFDFAADNRIFIGEKAGIVRVFENGNLLARPFIDISDQVNNIGDRGMLGLAVHPEFPTKPYIYLLYSYDPPEVQGVTGDGGPDGRGARVARLVRVQADPAERYNVALAGTEMVLLGTNSVYRHIGNPNVRRGVASCEENGSYVRDCLPADESSHTIGTVRFGIDGSLFVSNGDGANWSQVEPYAVRSLAVDSLAGKLMRIDPLTGQGYRDNPFYDGDVSSNRSKVYSMGLRNPFRFALHPATGEPFIGDVGASTWEELNTGRGGNFGWPCYEGGSGVNRQQGGYKALDACVDFYAKVAEGRVIVTPALYAFRRETGGSAIIAGDFYTANRFPSDYHGALFFANYNKNWIHYVTFDEVGKVREVKYFGDEAGVVQMSQGPDGHMYVMNIYQGKLKRLRFTAAGNTRPVARASASPTSGSAPLTVQFSSEGTHDPDGDLLSYTWSFGDGVNSNEANPKHTYLDRGVYTATLTVRDPAGATRRASVTISVDDSKPKVTISSPAPGARYNALDVIAFEGTATDHEGRTLAAERLNWKLLLHHNDHIHFDGLPKTSSYSGSFVAPDHGDNTWLELCLEATNVSGLRDTSCVPLYPNTVRYTLDTVPSGLELSWEGSGYRTPFTVDTIVNSRQQLIAPATQGGYTFSTWSDGGARIHDITVGQSAMTFVASYQAPAGGGALETLIVDNVGTSWRRVTLNNHYASMVAVCSVTQHNNRVPQVVRIRHSAGNQLELRLQNPSGLFLAGERVYCLVVEEGVWQLPDGRRLEAQRFLSTSTARKGAWGSQARSYAQPYSAPVVIGQVMSYNDARWSTFWSRGSSRGSPPNSTLRLGKHVGEDTATARQHETLGYVIFEAGSGTVQGVNYEAFVGSRSVRGVVNATTAQSTYVFKESFNGAPRVAVISQTGIADGDGSWAVMLGASSLSASAMRIAVDEDQIGDDERWHPSEIIAYVVFENNLNVSLTPVR